MADAVGFLWLNAFRQKALTIRPSVGAIVPHPCAELCPLCGRSDFFLHTILSLGSMAESPTLTIQFPEVATREMEILFPPQQCGDAQTVCLHKLLLTLLQARRCSGSQTTLSASVLICLCFSPPLSSLASSFSSTFRKSSVSLNSLHIRRCP